MLMCAVTLPGTCDTPCLSSFLDQYLVSQLPAGHQCSGAHLRNVTLEGLLPAPSPSPTHFVSLVNPNTVKLKQLSLGKG